MTLKRKRASIWQTLESLESGMFDLLGPFLEVAWNLFTGTRRGEARGARLCPAYVRLPKYTGHGHGEAGRGGACYL